MAPKDEKPTEDDDKGQIIVGGISNDGHIIGKAEARKWREEKGYCLTCDQKPIRLRRRQWPLMYWKSLTVHGKVENGKCLICQKKLEEREKKKREKKKREKEEKEKEEKKKKNDINISSKAIADNLENVNIQRENIETLYEYARKDNEMKLLIVDSGALPPVIESMKQHQRNPTIQKAGCALIWALSTSISCRPLVASTEGVCPSIINAIQQDPPDSEAIKMALGAAKVLSKDEVGRMKLRKENIIQAVLNIMSHFIDHPDIQSVGISLFLNMSFNPKTKVVSEVSEEQVEAVVKAMEAHAGNEEIQKIAVDALEKFVRLESNVEMMQKVTKLREVVKSAHEKYLKNDPSTELAQMILLILESRDVHVSQVPPN